ncbi:unnamed protein product [Toxocara canis]|uniref:OTU domain-containing protein n=1 Tax=Toxocara canis TaxID=6265 RepID=A0A183TYZ7_TOXCA|nr:unnamed protein product [Toxocara canis]
MSRNMQSEDVEHLCDVCYSKNALIHHSFVKLPMCARVYSLIVMLKRFEYGGKFASGCKRIDQIGIPLRIYLNKSIVSGTRTENGEHKRDDVIVMEERPKRIECQRDIKQDESGDQVGRAPPAIVSGCKRHCDGEFEEIMSEEETDDSNYASSELSDQRQLLKEGDAASHNAGSTSKEQFIRKQIRNHLGETYQRAQIDDYPAADCHFNHMNGSVCAQSVSEDGKELEEVGKKTTERMRLGGNDTNRKVDDGSQFLSIARECSADSDHTIHCGMHLGYSQADLGRTFEPHEHSSKSRLWLEENNWPTNDSLQMDVKVRQKKASSEKEKTQGTFKEKLIEVVDETSFASVEEVSSDMFPCFDRLSIRIFQIGGASLSACNVLFSPPSVAFLCRARSIFGLRRAGLSERSRLFASFTRTLKCIRFDSRPTETAAVCSDGNCLFRAISFLLTEGDEEQHMTIRTKVVNDSGRVVCYSLQYFKIFFGCCRGDGQG